MIIERSTADHWLYRWKDASGVLLYAGITAHPRMRRAGHMHSSRWTQWAAGVDVQEPAFRGFNAAKGAEDRVIREELPVFNKDAPDSGWRMQQYIIDVGDDPSRYPELFARRPDIQSKDGRILLAIPPDLRSALVESATAAGRSIEEEVVVRCRSSFQDHTL